MINHVVLMGRITQDLQIKYTQNGYPVLSFNVAIDKNYKQGEDRQADFITCVAWRNNAEFISKYFSKGKEEQNNFAFTPTPTAFNDEPQQPDYDYVDTEIIEEENNKLNEIFEKLNKNTNGKFNEEMESGNYERAVEIAKTQSKMKKISKEELEIFLSEIEQFY